MAYLDAQIIAAGSGAIILNSARKSFFFRISSSSAFFGTRRSDFCTAVSLRLCNWSTQRYAIETGPMRMACDKVLGTDLGTNKSAIAARYRGMPTFATKSEVQFTSTPSVMACTMIGERFVRQIGKHQAVVNPENAFLSGKWLIGRNMSKVNDELTQVPYNVIRDKNKNVKLECQPIGKQIMVEETSAQVNSLLDSMKWDDKGLVVAIAQNVDTGAVLMQGFANREALEATILSSKATFYSRSRSSLWTKGETSGNFINVIDIFLDCDCDSVIYLGKPDGPACHTGSETCYYSSIFDVLHDSQKTNGRLALSTLYSLESTISERKFEIETEEIRKPSWTRKLLQDNELLCSKIREEADELARTLLDDEDGTRTISEMGDLLYHAMVLLRLKDVKMEDVLEVLRNRFSQSGIEEKSSRS